MNETMVERLIAEMDKRLGTVTEGQPPAPKRASPATSDMDEATMCQFVALLREKWGPAEGEGPKLTLIQGGKGRAS